MNEARYGTMKTEGGWYVYDRLDERPVGERFEVRLGAEIRASKMNKRSRIEESIFESIRRERKRQDEKWGRQHHDPAYWFAILSEEVGEVAEAVVEDRTARMEKEMIEVAAVVVAWLEDIERHR